MSFNFNYNYNENKGNSFYEMMGLNKKAVDNITESEDICGSYAPDYEFEKDNEYSIKIDSEEVAHKLLEKVVANGVLVNKFEIKKPTLNDIFIEKVG